MTARSSFTLALLLASFVSYANAQTGGPGQPEFMQFQQAGTDGLVNPATGSFTYQIPLVTIGGYPMSLTYQSGSQMEDVASMVGLGWNINAGAVVRTLRGLPDDFDGDQVVKWFNVAEDATHGAKVSPSVDIEITGIPLDLDGGVKLSTEYGVYYNTYRGWGLEEAVNVSGTLGHKGKNAALGLGASASSQHGIDMYCTPSVGIDLGGPFGQLQANLGHTWSVNSTQGLRTSFNLQLSLHQFGLGRSSQSFLNNGFDPEIEYPFESTSETQSGELGTAIYTVDPGVRIEGYSNVRRLRTTEQRFAALGLLYDREPEPVPTLMDFNREKKLPFFIGQSRVLPIPYRTPDIFNINAQGISVTASFAKSDVGIVGDPQGLTMTNGLSAGLEGNFAQLFKMGGNVGRVSGHVKSGRWNAFDRLAFDPVDRMLGPGGVYRQENLVGHDERSRFEHSFFEAFGGYAPTNFFVNDGVTISSNLTTGGTLDNFFAVNERQPARAASISYLTASEAAVAGLDKQILYYPVGDGLYRRGTPTPEARVADDRKAHHLSEVSLTQPDGMRYVFGIPVYSLAQKEATFNVGGAPVDCARNRVTYGPNDNSVRNANGVDHYFEAMATPPYATQFLITAVLNPDYRDLTNDGISDDDLGNYVRFTYYKAGDYRWRSQVAANSATYNPGYRSDATDAKGSYVYGMKETYYLRSIESKTEVAEFYYSPRGDALGVEGEDGGVDRTLSQKLFRLDSIRVFPLTDRRRSGDRAVPTKTIHFSFDYSLCAGMENVDPNLTNGETGKLTLTSVAFAYETSEKGKLTPYRFEYGKTIDDTDNDVNPGYEVRSVNRWGHYQENPSNAYSDCAPSQPLSNVDAPYASQNAEAMDRIAHAWNVTGVALPSGGRIGVEYEGNDYAFVQDRVAGRMFPIVGLGSTGGGARDNRLYENGLEPSDRTRVYFPLDEALTGDDARAELERRYVRDLNEPNRFLYYKILVELAPGAHDYVSGYARIDGYGVTEDGVTGYVDLEPVPLQDEQLLPTTTSPMLKSALQFMRINRNPLFLGAPADAPTDFGSFLAQAPTVARALQAQVLQRGLGPNGYGLTQGFCATIDPAKSFIRLYEPDGIKLAGGSRVRSIAISDQWHAMTGGAHDSAAYVTSYSYRAIDGADTISSGVATYEPMIGGDEISLKQPIFFVDEKQSAPDTEYYVEDPVNESLFPAPQIIYGRVTQRSFGQAPGSGDPSIPRGRSGVVVNEFFTAKDHPVRVDRTEAKVKRDQSAPNLLPFSLFDHHFDFATVSQGYSIELNNMSGLPKSSMVYDESGSRVSGVEHEYDLASGAVTAIDRGGKLHRNSTLGVQIEYTVDGRASHDSLVNQQLRFNLDVFEILGVPVPIPVPFYTQVTDESRFKSIVVNKVIFRNAVRSRTTVYEQSSTVATESTAFDAVTGETLLTSTTNEFSDALYSFTYPAWWVYPGMGPAYRNDRLAVTGSNAGSATQLLQPGDELRGAGSHGRLWFAGGDRFLTETGDEVRSNELDGNYRVYGPGARNLLNASAGSVVTWNHDPLATSTHLRFDPTRILNSSSTEFRDSAIGYCDSCSVLAQRFDRNMYLGGRAGNWRPSRSWFYLADRTPTNGAEPTDIRREGLFGSYHDFWRINDATSALERNAGESNWEWKEKVNLVDTDGQTIESEDRIGRKVASLLGYKNTVVTAQAFNAGYNEAFFDGFEEYAASHCSEKGGDDRGRIRSSLVPRRLRSLSGDLVLTATDAHTGYYSLEVARGSSVRLGVMKPRSCGSPARSIVPDTSRRLGIPRLSVGVPRGTAERLRGRSVIAQPAAECEECVGGFYPMRRKSYLISCWVKVLKEEPILTCEDAVVEIRGAETVTLHPEGPVIEGWQRVSGTFTTGASVDGVSITLGAGDGQTLFDDLRIIPADANMVSYVYDDANLRVTHSLDENNYFTKNEYNNQGELIRVKRETEMGIVTVKEGNQSLVKRH